LLLTLFGKEFNCSNIADALHFSLNIIYANAWLLLKNALCIPRASLEDPFGHDSKGITTGQQGAGSPSCRRSFLGILAAQQGPLSSSLSHPVCIPVETTLQLQLSEAP